MVSTDPLEEPSLLLEMLDLSRFWRGIDTGLAHKWSTKSEPSLFPLPGDQLRLAEPVLLHLLRKSSTRGAL